MLEIELQHSTHIAMEKIIRTEDRVEDGLNIQYIFGTEIFAWNKVTCETELAVEFLKVLSQENVVSAHTRMAPHFAPSPQELFGPSREGVKYEIVRVGPGAGTGKFYRTQDWMISAPCFFPKATKEFWNTLQPRTEETWHKILYYDAVVFYADPFHADYEKSMKMLFENDSETVDTWMNEVLDIYRVAIMSGGDMNYFKAFTKDARNFDLFSKPIEETETIVMADQWYQENRDILVWDATRCMCLRLPTG